MRTYTQDKLPDQPVILFHGSEAYDWERDFPEMAEEAALLLDGQNEPVFLVADMSAGLSDVIFSTNYAARTGAQQFLHHPNMREFLAVTSSKVIGLAAQRMRSAIFGMVPVSVYPNLEEALEHTRIGS